MTKITMEEEATKNLKDMVAQACANRETVVITGPDGEVARLVPVAASPAPEPAYRWKGRPVYTQEQLAAMSQEQLAAIGLDLPDESAWMDELLSAGKEISVDR